MVLLQRLLLILCLFGVGSANAEVDPAEQLKKSEAALDVFIAADDSITFELDKAVGYAIFDNVGKGGIGIGGAYGDGVVFDADGNAIGATSLTQLTVGLQLGGQTFSELILFETEQAFNDFKEGTFELSAQISAVAAAAGAAAAAPYASGIKVLTVTKKGLMYEATVGGQKFSYDAY